MYECFQASVNYLSVFVEDKQSEEHAHVRAFQEISFVTLYACHSKDVQRRSILRLWPLLRYKPRCNPHVFTSNSWRKPILPSRNNLYTVSPSFVVATAFQEPVTSLYLMHIVIIQWHRTCTKCKPSASDMLINDCNSGAKLGSNKTKPDWLEAHLKTEDQQRRQQKSSFLLHCTYKCLYLLYLHFSCK